MKGRSERRLFTAIWWCLIVAGCGSATPTDTGPSNPARDSLVAAIAERPSETPLQVRYNPAACDCPRYELRIAKRWVRADWRNDDAALFATLQTKLRQTPPGAWPVRLLVKGRVDSEIRRTQMGEYALSFEATEVLNGTERTAPPQPQSKPATESAEEKATAAPKPSPSPTAK